MEKDSQELLQLMKNSRSYPQYLAQLQAELQTDRMKIDRALNVLLTEQGVRKSDVIARSGIEPHYAYQIFSGIKTPSQDKVIMLGFGFRLTVEALQQLMKVTGYAVLSAHDARDNAILYCLTKQESIIATNELLYNYGLALLK